MTKILGFHSTKGGVGTTLLAAHASAFARQIGLRVVGLEFDPTHELSHWLPPLEIPCLDGTQAEELPDDVDLIVVDWNTQVDVLPLELDLLVIPIDSSLSLEHAYTLSDRLLGPIVWLENHPHGGWMLPKISVPSYLSHVEVQAGLHGIPCSHAVREASEDLRPVWSTDDGARSAGSRYVRGALRTVLQKVGIDLEPRSRLRTAQA